MDSFFEYCNTHESSIDDIKVYYEQHQQRINSDTAFRWSCENGRLDVARIVYSSGNVNISQEHRSAFQISCVYGHLIFAQWLHSLNLKKTGFDILAHIEDDFRESCKNGHLDVAQWLYCLKYINIRANDDLIFKESCWSGHLHIAQWLTSICNNYIITNVNKPIQYKIIMWCDDSRAPKDQRDDEKTKINALEYNLSLLESKFVRLYDLVMQITTNPALTADKSECLITKMKRDLQQKDSEIDMVKSQLIQKEKELIELKKKQSEIPKCNCVFSAM